MPESRNLGLSTQLAAEVTNNAEKIKQHWMSVEDRQKMLDELSGDTKELRSVAEVIIDYCDTVDAMSEELKSGTTPLKSSPGVTGLKELLRNGFVGLMKPTTKKKSCWLKRFLFGQNA